MKNGDQPAYPDPLRGAEQSFVNQSPHEHPAGLTKREYFAAMAMQGILANRELQIALYADVSAGHYEGQTPETILAHEAITQADELLKQLEA